MSKLTEEIERARMGDADDAYLCIEAIVEGGLVAAHDAAIREEAKREQMEKCCKANCVHCLTGAELCERSGRPDYSRYYHLTIEVGCIDSRIVEVPCNSSSMRAALAKDQSAKEPRLCAGCAVRQPWEHRCIGKDHCGCGECRDAEVARAKDHQAKVQKEDAR